MLESDGACHSALSLIFDKGNRLEGYMYFPDGSGGYVGTAHPRNGPLHLVSRYSIAATDQHLKFVRLGLATIRDRSIEARARETEAPRPELLMAMDGFRPYHGLCSLCHSAPGLEDSPIRQGLNPAPPLLNSEPVQHRSDQELFWIVKPGIKMSGMPAFGPTHNDQDLWHIVAFVRQLPRITRNEYLAMVKAAGTVDSDHHGHEHHHPPSPSHE